MTARKKKVNCNTSSFSNCLPSLITANLENTWRLSCLPLINLSGDYGTQAEFCKPTPQGDRWWRRVRDSWNPLTQGIPWLSVIFSVLERVFLHREHLGIQSKSQTHPNNPKVIQTTKQFIKGWMVWTLSSRATSLTANSPQNVLIVQLLTLSPWTSWQSMFLSNFPCHPSLPTMQYPLHCHHPTALPGCRPRTSILIWRGWVHSKSCLCFPPSMFNPNLLRISWAANQLLHVT